MSSMITLTRYPKNKEQFIRLVAFLKEILDTCHALNIAPVLNGSLAVFAYTGEQALAVNDVDLACPEAEFPRVIQALDAKGIGYKLREWRVLQILKDDLKIELDSIEYWRKGLPIDCETLEVDGYEIQMLSLSRLKEFYRRGLEDRANKTEASEKRKYEALKAKFEALNQVGAPGQPPSRQINV
jgi:hypothetical protein